VTARVLIVDDEARFRDLYGQTLRAAGFETLEAADVAAAQAVLDAGPVDMVVSDVRMPGDSGLDLLQRARTAQADLPFLLVTAYADVRDAVAALKLGAVDYLTKPVDLDELVTAVRDTLGLGPGEDPSFEVPAEALEGIVASSPAFRLVLRDAWRVARSDVPVLLTGESGTGKEVITELLHRGSPRAAGPLVAVNCAAIPANLLASELFGHERGAFTGADQRRTGKIREAHGGTLFLDEIGDMPLELQPALLRVLETGRITPVGSDREVQVDYRLVAATNRDLEAEVLAGRFRADLFYRLNVIALELPPLRERPEDIGDLARHFLAHKGGEKKRLSRAAARALATHPWPGNVRELANAMERARLLSRTDVILPEHLPPAVRLHAPASTATGNLPALDLATVQTLEDTEKQEIRKALRETGGNRTRAAKLLGITRRGLLYKLKRYGLE
jgi:two-component system response regulator HydG